MTFVLVHGGGFDSRCWDRLLPFVPDAVAVDLPGRGSRRADRNAISAVDFAAAVVDEIVTRDLRQVVLVGHSLAGITLPRVANLIPERLQRLVFVACVVPPHGIAVADVLTDLSPATAAVVSQLDGDVVASDGRLHPDFATAMFCNDMDDALTQWTLDRQVVEAVGVISEPTDLTGLRHDTPITYVRLLRDASLTPTSQDRMIANLPGADVVDLDAGHMTMITQPRALGELLTRL